MNKAITISTDVFDTWHLDHFARVLTRNVNVDVLNFTIAETAASVPETITIDGISIIGETNRLVSIAEIVAQSAKQEASMVISTSKITPAHFQAVILRLACPMLIIPSNWQIKPIERITYITDVRYCRQDIVKDLRRFTAEVGADLSLAHLCAKGLPPIGEAYSQELFYRYPGNTAVKFNNIVEKDLTKTLDVLIHGLHNDVLAVSKSSFHFDEIVQSRPDIPLLVFPN